VLWYKPVISALGRLRQKNHKFKISLRYKTRPCLKKKGVGSGGGEGKQLNRYQKKSSNQFRSTKFPNFYINYSSASGLNYDTVITKKT
jgi:hypothetical protein